MLINRGAFYSFRAYLFEKEVFFAVKTERVEAANKAENVGFDFFNSLLIQCFLVCEAKLRHLFRENILRIVGLLQNSYKGGDQFSLGLSVLEERYEILVLQIIQFRVEQTDKLEKNLVAYLLKNLLRTIIHCDMPRFHLHLLIFFMTIRFLGYVWLRKSEMLVVLVQCINHVVD